MSRNAPPASRVRCAIYTRKSTDEGLDQEFQFARRAARGRGGLHPQPENAGRACLRPDHYDDGGFTGGNMERPALQRLLVDIEPARSTASWSTRWTA